MPEEPIPAQGIGAGDGSDPSIIITPTSQPFKPTFPEPPVTIPPPAPTPEPTPAPGPAPLPPFKGKLGGIPDLGLLGVLLVIFGLIGLVAALVEFLNWMFKVTVGNLPGGSKITTLTTKAAAQPLSNALGTAFSNIDAQMGLSFTTLGQLANRVGLAILAAEQTSYSIAINLAALSGHSTGVQLKTDNALSRAKHAQTAAAQTQTQLQNEKKAAQSFDDAFVARVRVLEQHITKLIEPELETLRHKIPELEKGHTAAWDEIKKHEELLGIGAMTATVAVAMGKLGADWTLCEANKLLGKANCGSGANGIKNLLEGLIDIAALLDLCQIVGLLIDVAESGAVQDVIHTLADGIETVIQCRGLKLASPLPEAAYAALAPAVGYVALAPVT